MSMFDPDARDRALTNHLNEILCHCRIGRVTKKVMIHGGKMVLPKSWKPDPLKPAPTPVFSGGYVHTSRTDAVPV